MRTALIIGSEGQDGKLASELLAKGGYRVLGVGRNTMDITDQDAVLKLMEDVKPDEIYYLAACHQSSQDKTKDDALLSKESHAVNVQGLLNFLEGIRKYAPQARLFYAASSLLFANTTTEIQDENTPFCPDSIYGKTKLEGLLLCRDHRARYNTFASVGILYNHESHYRRENFISRKIIQAAVRIKQGKQSSLTVGDLDAAIDWGYAPDYVQAMHLILNAPRADEFIIASGQKHTVREFVQIAFELAGLDWTKYVKEDPGIMTRKRKALVGNPRKLMEATGWRPSVDFKGMIKLLFEAEEVCV